MSHHMYGQQVPLTLVSPSLLPAGARQKPPARLLRSADWRRVGFQPEYGEFTAETWLTRWAEHDTVHLRQIEQTLLAYQQHTSTD